VTATDFGTAAGMDYRVSPDAALGFAFAGGTTDWSLAQGLGTGRSEALQAGVYGTARSGGAYVAAAFAFTNTWRAGPSADILIQVLRSAARHARSRGRRCSCRRAGASSSFFK
jgi:hypothetical protein